VDDVVIVDVGESLDDVCEVFPDGVLWDGPLCSAYILEAFLT